jgi:polyphosphate glucokinase
MRLLGIDIGGTGIKGALVDPHKGELVTDRLRIETPQPATPESVADVVGQLARHFEWSGPVGCTFPGVVRRGTVETAANVDKAWIGVDAAALFAQTTECPTTVVNDADAAGLAEMLHGAGKGRSGTVLLLTLGTGIGSALFVDGVLVPNTEFGHIEVKGHPAEKRAAESVREREDLSWHKWSHRLNEVFDVLERLLSPELLIIGGGVSKKSDKFFPHLETRGELVAAHLLNQAGIVGAAMAAAPPVVPPPD